MTTKTQRPFSVAHLIFAVIFLGIASLWKMAERGWITNLQATWIIPILLITAGGLGLLTFLLTALRPKAATPPATYADPLSPSSGESAQMPEADSDALDAPVVAETQVADTMVGNDHLDPVEPATPVTDETAPITSEEKKK